MDKKEKFQDRFKKGDVIYFWLPKHGGCYASTVDRYIEPYEAYLTESSLYVRETDLMFDTLEDLKKYGDNHKEEIIKDNGCGYSFGCDFLR